MLRLKQKTFSKCIILLYVFLVQLTAFSQGDTCNDPIDISADLPVNGNHGFTVDTSDGDKFFTFTAPEDGTFEISSCSNPSYLVIYNDACVIQHEQDMNSCFTAVHEVEMTAGETINFEFDGRNNVAGKESTTVSTYFQEDLAGESSLDAIPVTTGITTVTRYLGKQYFVYQTTEVGLLTIKTCNDGNPVDGTDIKLYDNSLLETLLVDNTWCSNDPDGDLAQSIIEYQVDQPGLFLIIEAEKVPFWYDSYDFELQFEAAGASCDNPIPTLAGNTYNINHAPVAGPYQSAFWYSFTADADGALTISNCDLIPGLTKVTVFDACEGTNLGVADSNCAGGAEITINMTEGESVRFKWDDHNEPDWNIEDFEYPFTVNFAPDEPVEDGASCETAFTITEMATYDVDNSAGDQWFKFVAPETTEIAITSGPNADGWGEVNLANGQDTKLRVYDGCGGTLIAESDDSAIVNFKRSYATLEVVAGNTYLIQWMDQFVNAPHQYQFEIFKVEDFLGYATEAEAEAIDVGVHRAFINYKNQHWFKYTFPSNGVLVGVNRDELEGRVIPSYQMLYGDNALDLELPYEEEISIQNWSDDEPAETNFMYEGVMGEEVLIRVENVGGIYLNDAGNRDFEIAFFEGAVYDDLCYYDNIEEGTHEINLAEGDQKYKYTATASGTHVFSADDSPALIAIYDQCFDDPLYTKYRNFYFEKEMEVGDELYLVFLDEYSAGITQFEINNLDEACTHEVVAAEEACSEYEFNGEVLTTSGEYMATFTNQAGCDSLVTLNLTILEATSSEEDVAACEIYTWNGTEYTTSGTYEVMFTNGVGCDSTATLNLTILEPSAGEQTVESCGSYDWNGTIYDTSGTYEQLLVNAAGCDSTATLNLTVHEALNAGEITLNGVVLFAEQQDDVDYQWYDCETDQPLEGENKRRLTPPRTGEYFVEVSNQNCKAVSECVFFDWILSTREQLSKEAKVYPTATTGSFTLDLNQEVKEVNIRVLSMSGQVIHSSEYASFTSSSMSIQGSQGMYVVQVRSRGQIINTQRIYKK